VIVELEGNGARSERALGSRFAHDPGVGVEIRLGTGRLAPLAAGATKSGLATVK
jgi:hypothetical protein